ncbi:16S rRNA (cytosine(1402)-N(4))-methyltransferase [Alteromonadaceae bacterium M269]|nr:16S rRNA (cytosine(1402)-N(4))-methyltransferase [Alteromonadaceae bacterium M269]
MVNVSNTNPAHESVLLNESIQGLSIKPDGIYLDATFGRGGHSRHVLSALSSEGRLIALDRDPSAIEAAKQFADDPRFSIHHCQFSQMNDVLESIGVSGQLDGILMDLGVSSPQLDESERGFSFLRDGPLDMRMDPSKGMSAADWLAKAELEEIAKVIKEYGEEKFGRRIAHGILDIRDSQPITTTKQLADVVIASVPKIEQHKHPATRTFQAIRIFINGELNEVEQGLESALTQLKPDGRLAVISFHSLEDRIVKRFMREQSRGLKVPHGLPLTDEQIDAHKALRLIGKAIKPSKAEIEHNPRSRSSVLRVAEKI